MGEGSSWITGAIFLGGGILSTYVGYYDNYMPNLLLGPVAILIGVIICVRAYIMHQKYRQQKRVKRRKRSITT
jgi:hypothetical protein